MNSQDAKNFYSQMTAAYLRGEISMDQLRSASEVVKPTYVHVSAQDALKQRLAALESTLPPVLVEKADILKAVQQTMRKSATLKAQAVAVVNQNIVAIRQAN